MERGPVAIVTAAGKGIGAAVARRLSADGYRLVLMSSSGAAERVADELKAVGLTGSVTSPEDLAHLVETAVEEFGQVTPLIQSGGGGTIVNVSTFSAFEPSLSFPVSSALRAGSGGFAKMYADRFGSDRIRMNNFLPGFMASYPESDETLVGIPAGRYGRVEDLAATVAFLLSCDAAYITGQNIRVDFGFTRSV